VTYLVGSIERAEIFKRPAMPEKCLLMNRYGSTQEAREASPCHFTDTCRSRAVGLVVDLNFSPIAHVFERYL
jgi:hypothetical protein